MFNNISRNKIISALFILLILLLAAFLRLYRISEYMTFLGDEGRDVIVAKGILEGKFTLLGPRASAGDFFTGPIYYYIIAPFLFLFNFDPVGPAVEIALIGIATVFLVYFIGQNLFNKKAGIIAAALYAVSPLVIGYSRSSWNPNPTPFFSLLTLFILYKSILKYNRLQIIISGIFFGILMQLHYQALWLALVIFLFIFFGRFVIDKKLEIIKLLKYYMHFFIGFIIGISPFLLFELRHGFPNTKTIVNLIFNQNTGTTIHSKPFAIITQDIFFRVFARLLTNFPPEDQFGAYKPLDLEIWRIITIILALVSIIFVLKAKNKLIPILMYVWLFAGVLLFGFYKKPIYDYYFQFLFPLPFLLIGNFLSSLFELKAFKNIGKIIALAIFLFLFIFNLSEAPFKYEPNRQKDQVKEIADFVLSKTEDKPFNFALITQGNSDHGYRYFLELANRKPVTIENSQNDPDRKTVTDQLLIVCEYRDCNPVGHPLWEIAGFGMAEVDGSWDISVVKIYKLKHYSPKK